MAEIGLDVEKLTAHIQAVDHHVGALRLLVAPQDQRTEAVRAAADFISIHERAERVFGYRLAVGPGLLMLLDLWVAEQTQRSISVSSLCLAGRVPPTTALRWLGELEKLGLVQRNESKADQRVTFMSLTAATREKLLLLFKR